MAYRPNRHFVENHLPIVDCILELIAQYQGEQTLIVQVDFQDTRNRVPDLKIMELKSPCILTAFDTPTELKLYLSLILLC